MPEYSPHYSYCSDPEIPNDYAEDVQCASCGQYFDGVESIEIGGEIICWDCSPAVCNGPDADASCLQYPDAQGA